MTRWLPILVGLPAGVLLALNLAADQRVTIDVNPRVLMAGGTIRLRCRVPRAERNRQLEYGVENYVSSRYDLEGADARITWETIIERVPCDVGLAYCAVRTEDGRWTRAVQALTVAGCGEGY